MAKRLSILVFLVLVSSLVLAGCGGGGKAGPPVKMTTFDGSNFSVQYPQDWKESNLDMFGLTMVIFSLKEMSMEEMQNLNFDQGGLEDPLVLVMSVPAEMAGDMGLGDIDSAIDEFDNAIPEGEGEIIKQGDVTLDGAQGKLVIAKGNVPDVGEVGLHLVAAKQEDGAAIVFMGMSPEANRDQNLDIFQFMQDSFKFKD